MKAGVGSVIHASLLGAGRDSSTGSSVGPGPPGPLVGMLQEREVSWSSEGGCLVHWTLCWMSVSERQLGKAVPF